MSAVWLVAIYVEVAVCRFADFATMTVATPATVRPSLALCVAEVAVVAVARLLRLLSGILDTRLIPSIPPAQDSGGSLSFARLAPP